MRNIHKTITRAMYIATAVYCIVRVVQRVRKVLDCADTDDGAVRDYDARKSVIEMLYPKRKETTP